MPKNELASVLLPSLVVLSLTYYAFLGLLFRRIKKADPAVYTSLGQPTLFNSTIASSFRIGAWVLFKPNHRQLDDIWISRLVYLLRSIWFVALGLMVWLIGLGWS
jgi:hypothetical protein